jgi:hypothetical protein
LQWLSPTFVLNIGTTGSRVNSSLRRHKPGESILEAKEHYRMNDYIDHDLTYASYHEAGHALLASILADEVRATVNGQAGGWTHYFLAGDDVLQRLRDWSCVAIAGAAAAELYEGRDPERLDPVALLKIERDKNPRDRANDGSTSSFSELEQYATEEYKSRELGHGYVRAIAPAALKRACEILRDRWAEVEDIAGMLLEVLDDGSDNIVRVTQVEKEEE